MQSVLGHDSKLLHWSGTTRATEMTSSPPCYHCATDASYDYVIACGNEKASYYSPFTQDFDDLHLEVGEISLQHTGQALQVTLQGRCALQTYIHGDVSYSHTQTHARIHARTHARTHTHTHTHTQGNTSYI